MKPARVNLTVEVDQVANALAIRTPVPIQLIHERGRWWAECESPKVQTPRFDTMEQAILAGTREVGLEIQANVQDRPLILGRITPLNVPRDMF